MTVDYHGYKLDAEPGAGPASAFAPKSTAQQKFLVTTPGLSATRWLSFALALRPDVFVSHGKHPLDSIMTGSFQDETGHDDRESYTQGNLMADFYNHEPLAKIFEGFSRSKPQARAVGNVHAYTIQALVDKPDGHEQLKDIRVVNLLRHPINYIASHTQLVQKAVKYENLRHHYRNIMFVRALKVFPELALFDNVPVDRLIPFTVSCLSVYDLKFDLALKGIPQVRMEDLVAKVDDLKRFCEFLTGLPYAETALQDHIAMGPINKHRGAAPAGAAQVYDSWENWQKDLVHMMVPFEVVRHFQDQGYDLSMFFAAQQKQMGAGPEPEARQPATSTDPVLTSPETPADHFASGNYVETITSGPADQWPFYAAQGLIGRTEAAIAGLAGFDQMEARFHLGVAHWMGGQDETAIGILEEVDSEHARNLLRLIKKPQINVLAQLPWLRRGASDYVSHLEDPKFQVGNITFHPDDLANQPAANVLDFVQPEAPPDFYIANMVEWQVIPPNLRDLSCPILGHTADFDLHIQAVFPWLKLFDALVVTDQTEFRHLKSLTGQEVHTYPKTFGLPKDLPPAGDGPRPFDIYHSGSLLHPYHPDKLLPLMESLEVASEPRYFVCDGFTYIPNYYELLRRSKATFTFIRHSGAMPTRALDALAFGCAVVVQEGSSLSLFAGEAEGVLTYRPDGSGLKENLRRIVEEWPEFETRARRGADLVRREFTLARVTSQYLRFLTYLAAKPRPPRQASPRAGLYQKRMVLRKGWNPSDSNGMHTLTKANALNLERIGRKNFGPRHYIDLARELLLDHAEFQSLPPEQPGIDPAAVKEARELIVPALEIFQEGSRRYPDSLPLYFNLVRASFHYGGPPAVRQALELSRRILAVDPASWTIDPLEDVFPWDFFSLFFDYRAYFDQVCEHLAGKSRGGIELSRLVYASLNFYLAYYENPVAHARQAHDYNQGFAPYKYRLAEMLLKVGGPEDIREAGRLMTELASGSSLFYEATNFLKRLAQQSGYQCPDLPVLLRRQERFDQSLVIAKAYNLFIRKDNWQEAVLQRP